MEPTAEEEGPSGNLPPRKRPARRDPHVWGTVEIGPGEGRSVQLVVSESFSGLNVPIPVHVRRGLEAGPTVFVTAAIHGDEINGTGTIRELIRNRDWVLERGTLILVPVVNIMGFDRHSRYLPDGRDLNRCFPGSRKGSLAARMARIIFEELVGRCDFGIDLHTASVRRTNFPNVRADLSNEAVARLAHWFGGELTVAGSGPEGSFRREACLVGCPTIAVEAGEVWKVEPPIVQHALRGIFNVLAHLQMTGGSAIPPPWQLIIRKSTWIRAELGGFLEYHVAPGDLVRKGALLATSSSLTGERRSSLQAPGDAIVLGMTTLPALSPGDPVCNLALISEEDFQTVQTARLCRPSSLEERMHEQWATSLLVSRKQPE